MNEHDLIANDARIAVLAEQEVLGALLLDNDAIDRVHDLEPAHFFRADNRAIFSAIRQQLGLGNRVDPLSLLEPLRGQVEDCLRYLTTLRNNTGSAVTIRRHADMVLDKAMKRGMAAIGRDLEAMAWGSPTPAEEAIAGASARLDELVKRKGQSDPQLLADTLSSYMDVITRRINGLDRPIATGFTDVDRMMDGGLERGTLTVVAGRPGTGKTAFGLGVARNMAEQGVALFLSMEMSCVQVNDRNVAALGQIPLAWLRHPNEDAKPGTDEALHWDRMSSACRKAAELRLFIDDQTGLNLLQVRSKARKVKRTAGALDVIVLDQLSFLTGAQSEKSYEQVGEYTRGLIALAKELDCAVVLLCQLNRKCEERPNKRPIAADLAQSGSIEQDAANIIMLYRDELYDKRPDNTERGICEVTTVKQRQGQPGTVGLAYIDKQTRFADLSYHWIPPMERQKEAEDQPRSRRGFG